MEYLFKMFLLPANLACAFVFLYFVSDFTFFQLVHFKF